MNLFNNNNNNLHKKNPKNHLKTQIRDLTQKMNKIEIEIEMTGSTQISIQLKNYSKHQARKSKKCKRKDEEGDPEEHMEEAPLKTISCFQITAYSSLRCV
jgi:hypothetical protein